MTTMTKAAAEVWLAELERELEEIKRWRNRLLVLARQARADGDHGEAERLLEWWARSQDPHRDRARLRGPLAELIRVLAEVER